MLKIKPVNSVAEKTGNSCRIILECETGEKQGLVWSVERSILPEGLMLDSKTGVIAGCYEKKCLKTVTIGLFSKRTAESTWTNINFLVQGEPRPQIFHFLTEQLGTVPVKQKYSFQMETEGGNAPIVFTADGLPPGISCSKQGELSGTVLTGGGLCPVWITATDALGTSIEKYFTLNILSDM